MKIVFVFIFIVTIISSCVSHRKIMNAWVGQSKQRLVLTMGPPARTASDANNGEIYIFESRSMVYNVVRYTYVMFYINSDDKIYSWRTESGPVPAQQMNVNLYIRQPIRIY